MLNRNALGNLSRVDRVELPTLSVAGLGIRDLTGLEWAVNPISTDLRNNTIESTTLSMVSPSRPISR